MVENEISFTSEVNQFHSFVKLLISTLLDPVGKFEWDTRGTDMVVEYVYVDLNKDVYVDEIERKEGKLERKVVESPLNWLSAMGLITTWDQAMGLLYLLGFKLNHIQEIVSY